ncbi:efflux RND transporter periplasmic adaptor subunit [Paenirhodobacter enshiensis]|uniref:Membrane protein n=1 Tax=Paenirhodobacter enshiensis TaxID=1105367 RepID=A0A086Y9J6_9RHOB|nr:efflux RND transporter periplasmic adaptor subunit [Paenirhodobacter enshiensis]KFI30946.1 membrane protein [Paenirhodobacter enshiensis]
MRHFHLPLALALLVPPVLSGLPAVAGSYVASPVEVTDWKAVYGQVEARDQLPARARLGGTLVELSASEGDTVTAGQVLGKIVDDKIAFQLNAVDAQIAALQAQLDNAKAELTRGEALNARGVSSAQQLDQLRTQVDVYASQIAAQQANRQVIEQQAAEGEVLAPVSGRVLTVPAARGAYVMAGETVATVGGGGFYLRLSVPERFTSTLTEGAAIELETPRGTVAGKLVKVYPLIEGGRVQADVEVQGLDESFVAARVLVRLPLAKRQAILVPEGAIATRSGLDFVTLADGTERAVLPGPARRIDGAGMVEVLTGLEGGETVVTP